MNKKISILVGFIVFFMIIFILQNNKSNDIKTEENKIETIEDKEASDFQEEVEIQDVDGNGKIFSFYYKGESYIATYSKDNWNIKDSYKIKNKKDMIKICQALIDIHPIHGSDMISYRTAEDLAYEWSQHNIAYEILPEDNPWRENAKDVDFDPADQGKNLEELYEARTGNK